VSDDDLGPLQQLALRPLRDDDLPALRKVLRTPEVARWWPPDALDDAPGEHDTRLTIVIADLPAGLVQFWEEPDPDGRRADVDIFLAPHFHGRGIGTSIMRGVLHMLVEGRGHHRVTLSCDVENGAALTCYGRAGFRRVGVMRRYERDFDGDGWHDGLLMDLLADDR